MKLTYTTHSESRCTSSWYGSSQSSALISIVTSTVCSNRWRTRIIFESYDCKQRQNFKRRIKKKLFIHQMIISNLNLMYCIFNYLHRFSPRFLIDVLLNDCCVSFLSCGWRSFWYLSAEITGWFLCLIKSRCFPTFTLRLTNLPYLPDFLRYLSLSPPYGRDFLLFTGINLNVYKIVYIILFFR